MKLLLINPNTSESVTARLAETAVAAASAGVEIFPVTGSFGARIISSRAEHAVAAHAALSLAATHHAGCDAVVLGVSLDSGLLAMREALPIPVTGMLEAGALTACMLGARFGVITLGTHMVPMYEEAIAGYGLMRRLAGIRAIDFPVTAPASAGALRSDALAVADELIRIDRAEVIVLAGALMAGWQDELQHEVPVPLLDPIACAVRMAELLAVLHARKRSRASSQTLLTKETVNLDPALARLLGRH